MDPLMLAAGNALVRAMATDSWQQARSALVNLWQRKDPKRTPAIAAELDATRSEILAARETDARETERVLAAQWQDNFTALLASAPNMSVEVQRVLEDELAPLLSNPEQDRIVRMEATAQSSGNVYQAGRDQTINER